MDGLSLHVDAQQVAGLLLSIVRVGAFVVASPILARTVPVPARLTFAVGLGLFLAEPVGDNLGLGALIAAGVANVAVGVVLGFLTGLLFHLFGVAGGLVDITSGLSVAMLLDPSTGEQAAVFSRLFHLAALTVFVVVGGIELVVRGLALSVDAVPLDGRLAPQAGLATMATDLVGRMLLAAAELALPILAALLLAEVVLGLASRFAPQANVFLLGLPAKLLVTLSMATVVVLGFPDTVDGVVAGMGQTFVDALRGLGTG